MFVVNDDLSIYATRGDIVFFTVTAEDNGVPYHFQPGDIVRMAIYGKKDADTCYMQKDFPVTEVCESVFIYLEEKDTKIGDIISKPKDYWYEVVLNPDTMPQTIIGYDEEDGAKLFQLLPESEEIEDDYDPQPEDFPVVDSELDMLSPRPVANSAVARAVAKVEASVKSATGDLVANIHNSEGFIQKIVDVCRTYTENFDKIVYGNNYTAYDTATKLVGGKWQMDCSSFQNLLIRGVTFDNSRYAGKENIEDPLFFNKFDPYEHRVANKMAQWLYDHGYTFYPASDFSNIEPGDLVFYSWDNINSEFHDNAFMHIDHVAMFLQKKNDKFYQTIQYEQYTPNFFYDVDEEYMSGAVLVARLPFPIVENAGDNIVIDSQKVVSMENATWYTVGTYRLNKPMTPGKMYTCCFTGRIVSEGSYFTIRGTDETSLYTNYGETWSGEEKEYKFSFICPDNMKDYSNIMVVCATGTGETRTATAKNFCLYEGYKRTFVDSTNRAPYPIFRNFTLASTIANDIDNTMVPGCYLLEFPDYYFVSFNIPTKTLKSGNTFLGSLGVKLSTTRRLPANLVGKVDGVATHYNGFLQISGSSDTGDVYVNTWSPDQPFQYIMANGVIAK